MSEAVLLGATTPNSIFKGAEARWKRMFPNSTRGVKDLSDYALRNAKQMAGVWNEKFLDRIFSSLEDSIRNGETVKDWLTKADAILTGFAKTKTPVTVLKDATGARADEFSPWYGDLVFRMESANSYSAGRYAEQFSPDGQDQAPFWLYSAINDDRVRDEHLALDGTIFRKDDPDGRRFLPPWDYNCRCMAIDVSAEEAGEAGYKVSRGADMDIPAGVGFPGDRVAELVPGPLKELARTKD